MAANFWTSTHSKLLLTREDVAASHVLDKECSLTEGQIRELNIYFAHYIQELTRATSLLRQRVAATAVVHFRRFYSHNDFCVWDPRLIAPACVYLASKVEEAPLQAKYLFQFANRFAGKYLHPPPSYELRNLLELELLVLQELRFNLALFSPYDALPPLLADLARSGDAAGGDGGDAGLAADAWGAVNDSYCTDVPLRYPPHVIALGCLLLAATLRGTDLSQWLSRLDADLAGAGEVAAELTELYYMHPHPIHPETCQRFMDILYVQRRQVAGWRARNLAMQGLGTTAALGREGWLVAEAIVGAADR